MLCCAVLYHGTAFLHMQSIASINTDGSLTDAPCVAGTPNASLHADYGAGALSSHAQLCCLLKAAVCRLCRCACRGYTAC